MKTLIADSWYEMSMMSWQMASRSESICVGEALSSGAIGTVAETSWS
jgi:hypothetical protein